MTDINMEKLALRLRKFADDREWNQFHSPKNLSMAIAGETGELIEHFQWLTEEQSENLPENKLKEVGEEMSDIFIYLIRLADQLHIDLVSAVENKILKNEEKYPIEKVRGSSKKYTEY